MHWFFAFLKALLTPFWVPAPVVAPNPIKPPVEPFVPPEVSVVMPDPVSRPAEALARIAEGWLGKDPSTPDKAPDNLACADSVSTLIRALHPDFKHTVSTSTLFKQLKESPHFRGVLDMTRGCVVVYPTVGNNIGHTMICLEDDDGTKTHHTLASNNSFGGTRGLFTLNYSRKSAREYFINKKGLKGHIFLPI